MNEWMHMDMPSKEQKEVYTYLILPLIHNSVIHHNQVTSIPVPLYTPIWLYTIPYTICTINMQHSIYTYILYTQTHPFICGYT